MIVSRLELTNFRSHEREVFSFDPKLTLITGKNGAGKTNILEAIYVLMRGTSFRGVNDSELTTYSKEWWRVYAVVDELDREVRYQPGHLPVKQLIAHDNKRRFTYKDRLPVVLFEPNDLLLIHGSPSRRRATFDDMLMSLSLQYKQVHGRYERALKQRNNALKQFSSQSNIQDQLFVWDIALAEYGELLIRERTELVNSLNKLLPLEYAKIAGRPTDISLRYDSSLPAAASSSQFIHALHKNLALDRSRHTTSIGPHRDDFTFFLNSTPAKQSASRGEIRSLVLALKLAYAELLHRQYQTVPVMLFDDVFSELDEARQANIVGITSQYQTILTDTKQSSAAHQIRL
jgi:DNA replication and repair protein RecF